MTLLLVMNLNFAWGLAAAPTVLVKDYVVVGPMLGPGASEQTRKQAIKVLREKGRIGG